MNRERALGVIVIVAVIAFLVTLEVNSPSAKIIFDQSVSNGAGAFDVKEQKPGLQSLAAHGEVGREEWRLVKGVPKDAHGSVSDTYDFLKRCNSVRQFQLFVDREKGNLNSPLFNMEAFDRLSESDKARLQVKIDNNERYGAACSDFNMLYPGGEGIKESYMVALEAALAGNQNASACFLARIFGEAQEGGVGKTIRNVYDRNFERLVQLGVDAGSWDVVVVAQAISNESHNVGSGRASAKLSYTISRLMQLGAASSEYSSMYGQEAAEVARTVPSAEILKWDEDAKRLYEKNFLGVGRGTDVVNFTRICE